MIKKTCFGKIKSQRKPKEIFQLIFDFPEANIMLLNISSVFLEKFEISVPILTLNLAKNPKNGHKLKSDVR